MVLFLSILGLIVIFEHVLCLVLLSFMFFLNVYLPAGVIVYKKTDEWYIEWQRVTTSGTTNDNEWQRMTTNDNEWQRVAMSGTTNGNEWQRMTTSDNEWCNKWQRVTTSNTTSDNEWQQIAMSDREWQQWHNQWKWHSTLQRMDDYRSFNNKNRYTITSWDGWLQWEWLKK